MTRKRSPRRSGLLVILLLAAGVSVYQYLTEGHVTWLGEYATRPEAGWRKAANVIEDLGAAREAIPTNFDITGKVVRIVDGDTVHVFEGEGVQTKIRLHGIDTPERAQPYYRTARDALDEMIAGKQVGVQVIDTDRYGRTVGVIYLDGRNINLAMVQGGHAWWYRKYAKYDRALQEAEKEARAASRGLWADPDSVPPWEWRRR